MEATQILSSDQQLLVPEVKKTSSPPVSGCRLLMQVARKIVKIAFTAIASTALLWLSPGMWVVGITVGVIYRDGMKDALHRIAETFRRQPWAAGSLAFGAGVIALPISIAVGALFFGGYIGSQLADS